MNFSHVYDDGMTASGSFSYKPPTLALPPMGGGENGSFSFKPPTLALPPLGGGESDGPQRASDQIEKWR
jgi:hypothetical protein